MTRMMIDNIPVNKQLLIFTRDFLARKKLKSPGPGHTPPSSELSPAESVLTEEGDHLKKPYKNPETWSFNAEERTLSNMAKRIPLTGIETLLLKQLLFNEQRVSSKTELIQGINRDPERYRGLEMCLSRLQEKFSDTANGERLFRSVRNRGYCLVQKVKITC